MPATREEQLRFERMARTAMRNVATHDIPYSELREIVMRARISLEDELTAVAAGKSHWAPSDISDMRLAMQRAIGRMTAEMTRNNAEYSSRMTLLGGDAIPESLERAGVRVALPDLDIQRIALARDYSAQLIQRVGQATISQVDNVLFTHAIGGATPYETQRQIASIFRTQPSRSHPSLGSIMHQAERVYRTEGMRIANLTNQVRMEQAAQHIEGMRKMWLHGGGGKTPRRRHQKLSGRTLPMDADFVYTGTNGEKYSCYGPHDPKLPASEVIHCTCTVVPVVPGSEDYDKTKGKILRNKIRSELIRDMARNQYGSAVEI